MAAHVEHRFEKTFLLDEERIRKIRTIVEERLDSGNLQVRILDAKHPGKDVFNTC